MAVTEVVGAATAVGAVMGVVVEVEIEDPPATVALVR